MREQEQADIDNDFSAIEHKKAFLASAFWKDIVAPKVWDGQIDSKGPYKYVDQITPQRAKVINDLIENQLENGNTIVMSDSEETVILSRSSRYLAALDRSQLSDITHKRTTLIEGYRGKPSARISVRNGNVFMVNFSLDDFYFARYYGISPKETPTIFVVRRSIELAGTATFLLTPHLDRKMVLKRPILASSARQRP